MNEKHSHIKVVKTPERQPAKAKIFTYHLVKVKTGLKAGVKFW